MFEITANEIRNPWARTAPFQPASSCPVSIPSRARQGKYAAWEPTPTRDLRHQTQGTGSFGVLRGGGFPQKAFGIGNRILVAWGWDSKEPPLHFLQQHKGGHWHRSLMDGVLTRVKEVQGKFHIPGVALSSSPLRGLYLFFDDLSFTYLPIFFKESLERSALTLPFIA